MPWSAKAQDTRLSAVEYKERVLEYSRQIKQSSEERIAMQHAIKAAKTGFFPSVDFSGSYQYRINKYDLDFGPGMSVEMDHNTYSLGATVSQPIYAGGQIYNNYKAAQVQGKITEQAEELTTDNIVYSADLNYWTAAARKGMYDVMCQYVDIVGELANVLTIRFNDGQISKTDLLQVKSRLKEAELNKSSAYKEYQIALQNLNSLMGCVSVRPDRGGRFHYDLSGLAVASRRGCSSSESSGLRYFRVEHRVSKETDQFVEGEI